MIIEESLPMMTLEQLARYISVDFKQAEGASLVKGVSIDSRTLTEGQVFFALSGERFDGHHYVENVLLQGAVAAVVSKNWVAPETVDESHLLRVADPLKSLGELAHQWRQHINPFVIALTGSNGKTTVKEMIAAVLRVHVKHSASYTEDSILATQGNLNNAIGVPLTLLRLRPKHRFAVIEMGMNHPGEIAYLSNMAVPDVALINTVQRAHIGILGSIEAIAHAKAEIFTGLSQEGVAVFPTYLPTSPILSRAAQGHRQLTFSLMMDNASINGVINDNSLTVKGLDETLTIQSQLPGRHNLENALAVVGACLAAGVTSTDIVRGLKSFTGVPGRLQSHFSGMGAMVIDDTYNANPDSVYAAIEVLRERLGRRILVLGDLGELGDLAQELHIEVGRQAKSAGIQNLFTLGELTRYAQQSFGEGGQHFNSYEELVAVLKPQLNAQTTVLVKGSRFMKMERVVQELLK